MQRETNDNLKKVISAISNILEENKIPSTPENIIKYTSDTIKSLLDRKGDVKDLLSVIFVFQDFLVDESELIVKLVEGGLKDKALRIIKLLSRSGRLLKGHAEIIIKYFPEEVHQLDLEVVNALGDEDFQRVILKYFHPKMNWKERKLGEEVLLKYLNYENENEDDVDVEYVLRRIKEAKPSLILLKVIGKILEMDRVVSYRAGKNLLEVDEEMKRKIKEIISLGEINPKGLVEFFSQARHLVIPTLIDVVRDIRNVEVLRALANQIGALELISIIGNYDLEILKGTSNNDLSLFLRVYKEEGQKAFVLIPSFCNYPTDSYGLVDDFLRVVRECLRVFYPLACSGLRNLIHSHEMNLSKEVILRNSIPREDSKRILSRVYQPEIFLEILRGYNDEEIPKGLLMTLSRKLQMSNTNIVDFLLNPTTPVRLGNTLVISNLKECLNYFKFFIFHGDINLEIISRVVELCPTEKKAMELLYYLEKEKKMPFCVCGHLKDTPSTKYKLLYLELVLDSPCDCGVDKKTLLYQNLLLAKSISTRRVAEGILDSLELSPFLGFLSKCLEVNSLEIVTGSISTFTLLLRKSSRNIPEDVQASFYSYISKSYQSLNALVVIKAILAFLRHTHVHLDVVNILEYYVDNKKKKYRSDIKEVVHLLLKMGLPVSRKLKRYTNFRIPTNRQTLTITKNDGIIISEEKIEK